MRAPSGRGGFGGRGGGGRDFGGRGGGGRGGGRGARGGGGGGRSNFREEGPPAEIVEAGMVVHDCESELLVRSSLPDKVPYFNAGVYLENKKKIGKVDEILGKINEVLFTVKMDPGVVAKSFQPKDLIYIGTDKLLPLTRFTNPSKPGAGRGSTGGRTAAGRSGGRGGGRTFSGGRGGGRTMSGRGRTFSGGRSGGRSFSGARGGGRGRF